MGRRAPLCASVPTHHVETGTTLRRGVSQPKEGGSLRRVVSQPKEGGSLRRVVPLCLRKEDYAQSGASLP